MTVRPMTAPTPVPVRLTLGSAALSAARESSARAAEEMRRQASLTRRRGRISVARVRAASPKR